MAFLPNHEKISANLSNGLLSRGNPNASYIDETPINFLSRCSNAMFRGNQLKSRFGSAIWAAINSVGTPVDSFVYRDLSITPNYRIIVSFTNGKIAEYRTAGSTLIANPLDAAWNGRMSCCQIGTRLFIMPYSKTSLNMYVWDNAWGSAPREAGGLRPSGGGAIAVAIGGAGKIERGTHVYRTCFETNTGFLTRASDDNINAFASNGNEFHNLSNIITGPAGTVARVIIVTKGIQRWDGNVQDKEYFFLPGGRIADNATTVLNNVAYYDADLISSADYLIDQLERVPSAMGLSQYNGRLITLADKDNRDTIRISKVGEPESFDAVDGFIETSPNTNQGVIQVGEHHGVLYVFKFGITLATQDNDDVPSTWAVETIDKSKSVVPGNSGVLSRGVAKISGVDSNIDDQLIVATLTGLYSFTGTYLEELSYNIAGDWKTYFGPNPLGGFSGYVEDLFVDSVNKLIYVRTDFFYLVGDFWDGLDVKTIKWYYWFIGVSVKTAGMIVDETTRVSKPYYIDSLNIYDISEAYLKDNVQGSSVSISVSITVPNIKLEDGWVHQIGAIDFNMGYSGASGVNIQFILTNSINDSVANHQFNISTSVNQIRRRLINSLSTYLSLRVDSLPVGQEDAITTIKSIDIYIRKLYQIAR
jgi:hypothetical protein